MDLRRQYCWKDAYLTVPEGKKNPAFFIWICLTNGPDCFFLWKIYTSGYSARVLGSWSYLLPNCQLEMLVLLAKAWVIVPRSVQNQRHIISYLLWEKAGFLSSYDQSLCGWSHWGSGEFGRKILVWENKNSPMKLKSWCSW